MRTVLVLGIIMVFGTAACDGSEKKEKQAAPAKAKAKSKSGDASAKGKDEKAEVKAEDAEIAVGKDGKAQPLGVPGM